jgi:AcrR family transcriptional regulator
MGSNERRERAREEMRESILNAARELFAADGADAVTMRRIADRIEYTPTAIYLHFKDKAALLTALLRSDFAEFSAYFVHVACIKDPVLRIAEMGHAYVRFAQERPNHYRLLFMAPIAPPEMTEKFADDAQSPDMNAYLMLRVVVESALQSGRLRPEHTDVHLICQSVWSAVHGIAALAIAMRHMQKFEWRPHAAVAHSTIQSIMRGLVADVDPYFATASASVAVSAVKGTCE